MTERVYLRAKQLPYRHSFADEPAPTVCGCWDCAAMGNGAECTPDCVYCNHPNAVVVDCAGCGAGTWHDDGRCLRCGGAT